MTADQIINALLHPESVSQAFIAILGVSAVALTQDKNPRIRRWASVLGLVSQPFWFYSAWAAHQWGLLALCGLYTTVWSKGFYAAWIKPPQWTVDEQLAKIAAVVGEDARWMASNQVASELTARYLALLEPGWHAVRVEHVGSVRARLGIEPPRDPAETAFDSLT